MQSFSFPENRYVVRCLDTKATDINTIGLHSRGSGWTEFNEHYAFPVVPEGVADTLQYQIEKVEDMLMDEGALELAFEGQRFYDLRRWATDVSELNDVINRPRITRQSIAYEEVEKRSYPSLYVPIPYTEVVRMKGIVQNAGWSNWE